jgi:hypothetical protein
MTCSCPNSNANVSIVQGGYLERKHRRKPNLGSSHDLSQPSFTSSSSSSGGSSSLWLDLLTSAVVNATAGAAAEGGYDTTSSLYSSSSSNGLDTPAMSELSGGGFGNFSDVIHTNLDLLTLSNVYPGSKRMWVHLASVYVITLVALKVRSPANSLALLLLLYALLWVLDVLMR